MSIILETRNLCKKFRNQHVNDNVSIVVEENSIYGLLGPNGAGKSTLLKMLTGMLTKTSGEIYFQGKSWKRKDLASIGALIEAPPLYENLTAYENLKTRALLYGLPDARIREVLEIVSLTDTGKNKAKNIVLTIQKGVLPKSFYGNQELIYRAVSNVLKNAIEYTPELGTIEFIIDGTDNRLTFTVSDSGKGFSDEGLRFATQEFYTERKERSGKHYGLGLFIAKKVAERHNGALLLTNKDGGCGAAVTLIINRIDDKANHQL